MCSTQLKLGENNMQYKIWDRKEKINGVEASHFLNSQPFKNCTHDIILIYDEDTNKVSQIECKDTLAKVYNIDINLGLDAFMLTYFDKLAELEAQAQENLEG